VFVGWRFSVNHKWFVWDNSAELEGAYARNVVFMVCGLLMRQKYAIFTPQGEKERRREGMRSRPEIGWYLK
jgi:hypothetical protein